MRPGLKLIILTLACITSTASHAGCDESRAEQLKRKQSLETYVDDLKKKPKEDLTTSDSYTIKQKFDFTSLDTAIAICPVAARTYGVSNVWYSFSGSLYVLPYELTISEADRISGEICSYKEKSKRLSIYFVDRLSVLKMNSLKDIERLGNLEEGYLRICPD